VRFVTVFITPDFGEQLIVGITNRILHKVIEKAVLGWAQFYDFPSNQIRVGQSLSSDDHLFHQTVHPTGGTSVRRRTALIRLTFRAD